MEEKLDNKNNENEIDISEFLGKYKNLLQTIATKKIMQEIEDSYRIVFPSENKSTAIALHNSMIVKLFEGNEEHIETFTNFMRNVNISFQSKVTANGEINSRLIKLRNLYCDIVNMTNNALIDPFNIASTSATSSKILPTINITITRNDGQTFSSSMNFNSMINLITNFTDVLNNRFNSGNNEVDFELINNYINTSSELIDDLQQFKEKVNLL